MFEPSRLAAAHLADAYAQVVPTLRRTTKAPAVAAPSTGTDEATAASAKQGGRP